MSLKVVAGSLISIRPCDGSEIDRFARTPPEELVEIHQRSKQAFRDWSTLSLKTRLELFKKAYRQFYEDREEVATLISAETGKPLIEAYSSEIMPVLDCFKYYIRNAAKFLSGQKVGSINPMFKLRKGIIKFEPLGVIAVISPWNYPFLLAMQHIIPAIIAGNCVIHKPSEQTSLTGLKIREIFDRAYLPRGVLEIVTGLADVGKSLTNMKLDKIIFTGSTAVGMQINQSAAQNLIPVHLELGGSDPMIVLQDAHLERAVNAAVWGAFTNAGQACVSIERIYIQESIFDDFIAQFVTRTKKIKMGPADEYNSDVSCLTTEEQFQKVVSLVRDAVNGGAVIHSGAKVAQSSGNWYYEPTILTNVNSSMEISRNEIFGPIVLVYPFLDVEQAVFMANDSDFGLSTSVWTENRKKGIEIAGKIDAGTVLINDTHIHVAQIDAPYSGFKDSGLGVGHGVWGLREVVKPKYISIEKQIAGPILKLLGKLRSNNLWWYKYDEKLIDDFRVFFQFLHAPRLATRLRAIPATIRALFRKNFL